ncbi:Amino acid transporter, transmembrane [Metarhizium album ARSEF 1941]|uniref:Amino acid transporter, transmembrane n=1 Tax=Metarhizium album (strain ARSEF 1941) TaxID=1081103 RepID=A0A0B2WKL8_METAS|nr:Amino acid transporter, transmembrane [Metarhizium album ARSEF 1941]KHN94027.1 Amino acid transporter, transmembrane [Metarhizium album ARSEF 1941]
MPMSNKSESSGLDGEPRHLSVAAAEPPEYDGDAGLHDAVFGDLTGKGPNYRNVGWVGTVALMMKTQVGLGVLSIPATFDTLGLIPGLVCLLAVAAVTTWSDHIVGVFKRRHPEVYGIDDAGGLMFGRIGREALGAAFCVCESKAQSSRGSPVSGLGLTQRAQDWIFVAGSGMLGISISLNAVSSHGACTAGFVAVAAVAGFMLASIRTLARISWLAWAGLTGILVSSSSLPPRDAAPACCQACVILLVTVAVAVQDRPAAAPPQGPWASDFKLVKRPSFAAAVSAVASIVFAYAGTPAFFSIAAEMRDPRHYTRSLLICQAAVTVTYVSIGTVVYYYCGSYVASPALGSAGPLVKRIAYGLALPGLVATTTIVVHLPAKYAFVRILRGSKHLTANDAIHWATWLSCTLVTTVIAYLIASGIPVFGGLVSLVGALLGTLMSFQPMGCMWLYDNWHRGRKDPASRWIFMVVFSILVVVTGTFLMVAGTYGSIVGIIDSYNKSGASRAWTCADNSNSA